MITAKNLFLLSTLSTALYAAEYMMPSRYGTTVLYQIGNGDGFFSKFTDKEIPNTIDTKHASKKNNILLITVFDFSSRFDAKALERILKRNPSIVMFELWAQKYHGNINGKNMELCMKTLAQNTHAKNIRFVRYSNDTILTKEIEYTHPNHIEHRNGCVFTLVKIS